MVDTSAGLSLVLAKAEFWHKDQVRKYTGEPYINHPVEVMNFLQLFTDDHSILAAALLHDVVEDTDATLDNVRTTFGDDIAMLVNGMTEPEVPAGTNREKRKETYRKHLEQSSWRVKFIKFGDIYSNTKDIAMHDPDFAVVYLSEIERTIKSIDDDRIPLLMRNIVKDQLRLAKLYVEQFQYSKRLGGKIKNACTILTTIKKELL